MTCTQESPFKSTELTGFSDPLNFNNSILELGEGMIMAWRAEHHGQFQAQLRFGGVEEDFKVYESRPIRIPQPTPITTMFEDPRLFLFQGMVWVSFVAACYDAGHVACIGICRFELDGSVRNVIYPRWGNNFNLANGGYTRKGEKNWTFFEWEGELLCVYEIDPLRILRVDTETGECELVSETRAQPAWQWGRLSGSTGVVPHNGKLLSVFHSFLPDRVHQRVYHAGFYEIDPRTWKVTSISVKPVLSAVRDEAQDLRPKDQWWRPSAIFPCGLVARGDEFLVSYGWQDCRARILTCPVQEVLSDMKSI
jgi:predicted GH43/DUF377 family glycosyl hydrolase